MVERRTAAAGAVGPRHSPLQIRPEKLKIQRLEPLPATFNALTMRVEGNLLWTRDKGD